MADIQFDITLDLVEKYVPAENVTVVQEDYQSVKFVYTILNREQPVDLSGATDIVVSFVKPDGHIVLQNDGTLVNGKIELVANPQAFTYVGKTYFQVQYKIGTSIYNTRQAFLWVERGNTSCQTLSSIDFAPMLDQAIQAGQMLSGIDLQALIDSKVTAENAQKDVDNLEIRVGALEVTIVGLDSRVDALEASQAIQDGKITTLETGLASVGSNLSGLTARVTTNETAISGLQASQATQDTKITALETGQANLSSRVTSVEGNITTVVSEVDALQLTAVDHENRIDGLEASMPNLDPINTAITALQAKDVEQDGRIGINETAISGLQTKNTQQDTAIASNATEIGNLQAEQTTQNNRLTAVENKNAAQDSAIGDIQTKDTQQDAAISALQSSQATQDTDITAIKVKNTQQDTAISANASSIVAVDTKVDANKTAQDTINSGVAGSLSNHSTRIDALEADATVDDARITNLEGDNTSNKNRIASVEGAIGVLNSDINELQGNDAVQDSRLNTIETKNANQDIAISDNTAAITANKADADSKITGLTTRVSTTETDIVNLKAKDTQQDTRMNAIENKNDAQDTRMTTIEGVNTAQNTRLTDIENKNTSQDTAIAGKVSKTGDLMTGQLDIQIPTSGANGVAFKNTTGEDLHKFIGTNTGAVAWQDRVNNIDVFTYSAVNKTLTFLGDTNLVRKTGDRMSGDLLIDRPNAATHRNLRFDTDGTADVSIGLNTSGKFLAWDQVGGNGIWEYDKANKAFNVLAPNTNLMKKTGDTATGHMIFRHNINQETADGLKGVNMVVNSSVNKWSVAPKMDGTPVWANEFAMDLNTGKVTVPALATKKDGRADLTLTADALVVDSNNPPLAGRRGNTVTFRCYMQRKVGSASNLMTVLPVDMRPLTTLFVNALAHDGTVCRVTIGADGNVFIGNAGNASTEGKQLAEVITYVVD